MQKTVKFYTLGCKVNQYETQLMRERFLRLGFREIDNGAAADFYLINTCTVTQRADSESLSLIRHARRENPQAKLMVTGCLTELDGARIRQAAGRRLVMLKNKDKGRLAEFLPLDKWRAQAIKGPRDKGGISGFFGHTRAFLKIQDGCDNFCSYCKVPLVRGRSESRLPAEIIAEAERLVRSGFKEIVLCGICLGAYGRDLRPPLALPEVLRAIEEIPGLLRLRLSSIESVYVNDELISHLAGSKKLCRQLHIPLQSGDDEILSRMNRKYSARDFLGLVRKLKRRIPGIAITTDVLVGFPGEEERHFAKTVELIKRILPLKVHIFPYSAREGTAAAESAGREVSPPVIKQRIALLRVVAERCSEEFKQGFLDKRLDVLVEGKSKEGGGFLEGYTDNYIKVLLIEDKKQDLTNQLIPVSLLHSTRTADPDSCPGRVGEGLTGARSCAMVHCCNLNKSGIAQRIAR